MKQHPLFSSRPSLPVLLLAGLLTGFANGLFGAGGGILAVAVLERFCRLPAQQAHASALLLMAPLTAVSLLVCLQKGSLLWEAAPFTAAGLCLGSLCGAKLLGKVPRKWLERIFFALTLFSGARLLF